MSSNNWWANKLGAPAPAPMPTSTPPVSAPPYNPVPQQQPPAMPTVLPPSANSASCPNCRSGNYGSSDPNIKARCYDCGYPVVQSASGTPGFGSQSGSGGPVQKARQISTANNYNPQGIIGHI